MSFSFTEFCVACASEKTHNLIRKHLEFQVGEENIELNVAVEVCVECGAKTPSNEADLTVLAYKKSKTPCPEVTIPRQLAIDADSEFSAMAHGRPQPEKSECERLSYEFRKSYEGRD